MSPFLHQLRVRAHECDPQGVVFNANQITYVDVTLTELFRASFGSYGALVQQGYDVVVADLHAAFRSPARFDDLLDVRLAVQAFGRTSTTMSWATTCGDRVCVEGEVVYVWIDPTTFTPIPVPDLARRALQRYSPT
jgi:acyl-CoA thioester hydrolase